MCCSQGTHAGGAATEGCSLRALSVAAALERGAVHPIARSVLAKSEGEGMALLPVDVRDFRVVPGEGVEALVAVDAGAPLFARMGNLDFAVSTRVAIPHCRAGLGPPVAVPGHLFSTSYGPSF